jgi:biopolymer transport protein ExbB
MHWQIPVWRWLLRALAAMILWGSLWNGAGPLAAQQPQNSASAAETTLLPAESPPLAEPAAPPSTIPTKNLLQVARDGGPMMFPLGLSSFLLLVFVFERLISLRRGRVIPKPFVKRFLEQIGEGQLDREMALELCEQNRSPVAEVFGAAARKWGRPAVEVEQAIIDAGERITHGLRKYLRILNGISTVSPLLGLLGTVLGIINCFNTIARSSAMGHYDLLAGGIGEALLTTAAGLFVAIPALIAYLCFVGRVDQLIMEIDAVSQKLVDLISAEAQAPSVAERRAAQSKRREAA